MKIGKKLLQIRKDKGISGEELSRKSGLAQSTISKIENNAVSPTLDSVEKLCNALDIDLLELLPVEYVVKRQQNALSNREIETIDLLHKMTLEEREYFLNLFRSLLENR